jgi:hypothetical protein
VEKLRLSKFIAFVLGVAACLCGAQVADAAHSQPPTVAQNSSSQNGNVVWSKSTEERIAQRDFYGLTSAAGQTSVTRAVIADELFRKIQTARAAALAKAIQDCKQSSCFDDAMRWNSDDIAAIAAELRRLYVSNPAIRNYVDHTLRESGQYPVYRSKSGEDLLAAVWTDAAQAMNRIIQVYGDGVAPYYKVDTMQYDASSKTYPETLSALERLLQQEESSDDLFFSVSMRYAVRLLEINDRLDAARFDPLEYKENAPAIARARSINWSRYPYSVILVPGAGPEDPGVEISPMGRILVEQAVRLYREGRAPFILVSGGTVHPPLTKYCEAVEMRKVLIENWNIPANAILIDPYARHTTTNLRNAVREIDQYHLPSDKPLLITTDYRHLNSIMAAAFDARCLKELHFRPYSSLHRISQNEAEMMPNLDSLQVDAMDPLDP